MQGVISHHQLPPSPTKAASSPPFPQVDVHHGGSLAVPGADEDARRIQAFVEANLDRITNIYVTLDSHQVSYMLVGVGKNGASLSTWCLLPR